MSYGAAKANTPRMPDAPPESDQCKAYRCPLRATVFPTVAGARVGGICRYHDRLAGDRWREFTDALLATSLREACAAFRLPYLEPDAPKPAPLRPVKAVDFDETSTFRRLGDFELLEERRAMQDQDRPR